MDTLIEISSITGSYVSIEALDITTISVTFFSRVEENLYEAETQNFLYQNASEETDSNRYRKIKKEEEVVAKVKVLYSFNRVSELSLDLDNLEKLLRTYKQIRKHLLTSEPANNHILNKTIDKLSQEKIELFNQLMNDSTKTMLHSFEAAVKEVASQNITMLETLKSELSKNIISEYSVLEKLINLQQAQNSKMVSVCERMTEVTSHNLDNIESRTDKILNFIEKFTNEDTTKEN